LNFRGLFRSEEMFGAIEMGFEASAVVGDFAKFGKTENLIAAGIGEDGAIPGHEFVQATKPANEFMPRTKI
jgi:hypothetical protein